MANKAQQNLQNLDSQTAQVQAVQNNAEAATRLAQVSKDDVLKQARAAGGGGAEKAEFGTTAAVVTGLMASFVLGPVVGGILALAQGWNIKNARKDALGVIAKRESVWSDSNDSLTGQLDGFDETAVNDNDRQQISNMRKSLDRINGYAESGDPVMMSKVGAMTASLDQDMTAYSIRQEDDRINLEAQVKADARQDADDLKELGIEAHGRWKAMDADYRAESAPWVKRGRAIAIGREALTSNNPAMLNTALVMLNKAIDEDSAVLQGEKDSTAAIGTIADTIRNTLAQLDTGAQLTDTQRRNFDEAFISIADISDGVQKRLDTRYQGIAVEDLIPKYRERFDLLSKMPTRTPLDIPDDLPTTLETDAINLFNIPERMAVAITEGIELHGSQLKAVTTKGINAAERVGSKLMEGVGERTRIRSGLTGRFPNMGSLRPHN